MRPLFVALVVVLGGAGCAKTMTDDDCRKVGASMREVWLAESKRLAPPDGDAADRAAAVIKTEGDKLLGDWATDCKKELQGRRVDPKEMDCLLRARSLEQITKCAEL